ncbi:MAG TPA: zf-HC2 domain-containing protein [Dehalococcoidia bacterium]|nr:zf-HC2 domain-containing protein [Dehalococcoidia bacterium]
MTEATARCIDPAAIREDDIDRFVHGEASEHVAAHVERCPACGEEARDYGRLARLLRAGLFRATCPDSLVLGEYALGSLSPQERQSVAAHLVTCPHCLAEMRTFATFLSEDDADAAAPARFGAVRRLVAALLPRPSGLALGLRGGESEALTYSVEGMVQLTVSVQRAAPGAASSVVTGLVQPGELSCEGVPVALFSGDDLVRTEAVDDLGNFVFSDIPSGLYRIEINVPASIVVIDPLRVP